MRLHPRYVAGIVLCGVVCALGGNGLAATDPQTPPDGPDNAFARANPNYRARAGAFYEKEYLGKALDQLAAAGQLTDAQKAVARRIVRGFIDDWLESYVSGDGRISRRDLARCLALMDERFREELSPAGYGAYLRWRKDETGDANALAFLMNSRFAVRRRMATKPALNDPPPSSTGAA